jgi:hypothetical protein
VIPFNRNHKIQFLALHPRRGAPGLVLLLIWLLSPSLATAEGLWDTMKSGAVKGGAILQEGAEKSLELGGALTKRGLEVGKGAVEDTFEHFYRGGTPEEIRARVDQMAFDTLDRLFSQDPEAHLLFDSGYGYAVFEVRQVSMTVLAGYGYGVAVSNDGSRRIYMKMVSGGVEVSKGVGGFASRWVVLYEDQAAFDAFVTEGFDASAETSGTLGSERAELGARYRQGIAFYRVTEGGLRLAASLSGTKFWSDDALNAPPAEVLSGPDLAAPEARPEPQVPPEPELPPEVSAEPTVESVPAAPPAEQPPAPPESQALPEPEVSPEPIPELVPEAPPPQQPGVPATGPEGD